MTLGYTYTNDVVSKALDGHWARHDAISSNLANAETPGYKRKHVHFEASLSKAIQQHRANRSDALGADADALAMRSNHASHATLDQQPNQLAEVEPQLVVDENYSTRPDENGVDVEVEMVTLAENTEHYLALNNIQGRLLRSTKSVLSDAGHV